MDGVVAGEIVLTGENPGLASVEDGRGDGFGVVDCNCGGLLCAVADGDGVGAFERDARAV